MGNLKLLPLELHLRIQVRRIIPILSDPSTLMTLPLILKLLRDPDMTLEDFKPLRLVCKAFDVIWSPVVLFRLFLTRRTGDPVERLDNLIKKPCLQFQALTLEDRAMDVYRPIPGLSMKGYLMIWWLKVFICFLGFFLIFCAVFGRSMPQRIKLNSGFCPSPSFRLHIFLLSCIYTGIASAKASKILGISAVQPSCCGKFNYLMFGPQGEPT
jgi:hypothetical protein